MYSFRSLLFALCLALFSGIAYSQVNNYWGSSVSTPGQCKQAIKSELQSAYQEYCGSLTSTALNQCKKYTYNPIRQQLTYACKTFGKQWNMYVSRQSPVNILGSINIDYSSTTPYINGRKALDVTTSNFIDVSELFDGSGINFIKNGLNTYNTATPWTITMNAMDYKLREVRVKSPTEHTMDGLMGDYEVQFLFDVVDVTVSGVSLNEQSGYDRTVAIAFLLFPYSTYLDGVACPTTTGNYLFDDFIKLENQVNNFKIFPGATSRLYSYAGSDTEAPYSAHTRWFVSAYGFATDSSISWPKALGYPNRPPPRALYSEVAQFITSDPSSYYDQDGCIVAD